jgi:hypothetical protein
MYLKTKFRKRNRLKGAKTRKHRRKRSMKRGGAALNSEKTYKLICDPVNDQGKTCCKISQE